MILTDLENNIYIFVVIVSCERQKKEMENIQVSKSFIKWYYTQTSDRQNQYMKRNDVF